MFSLVHRRLPGTDNPDVLAAVGMGHNQNPADPRHSNRDEPLFRDRMIRVMISHRQPHGMKPCAFCDSALLCRGPIQNSLSHFNPPLPTTQRLRNSSLYLRLAPISYELLLSTSCRKELRSRNGID